MCHNDLCDQGEIFWPGKMPWHFSFSYHITQMITCYVDALQIDYRYLTCSSKKISDPNLIVKLSFEMTFVVHAYPRKLSNNFGASLLVDGWADCTLITKKNMQERFCTDLVCLLSRTCSHIKWGVDNGLRWKLEACWLRRVDAVRTIHSNIEAPINP